MDDKLKDIDVLALPPATPPISPTPRGIILVGSIGHMDASKIGLMAALTKLGTHVVVGAPPGPAPPVPKLPKETLMANLNFPEPSIDKRADKRDRKAKRPAWRR